MRKLLFTLLAAVLVLFASIVSARAEIGDVYTKFAKSSNATEPAIYEPPKNTNTHLLTISYEINENATAFLNPFANCTVYIKKFGLPYYQPVANATGTDSQIGTITGIVGNYTILYEDLAVAAFKVVPQGLLNGQYLHHDYPGEIRIHACSWFR